VDAYVTKQMDGAGARLLTVENRSARFSLDVQHRRRHDHRRSARGAQPVRGCAFARVPQAPAAVHLFVT